MISAQRSAMQSFPMSFLFFICFTAFATAASAGTTIMKCNLPNTTFYKQAGGSYFMSAKTNWEWFGWCDGKEKTNQRLRQKGNTSTAYKSMQSINAGASHTCVSRISVKTDENSSVEYNRETTIHWLEKYYSASVEDQTGKMLDGYPKVWDCEWVR